MLIRKRSAQSVLEYAVMAAVVAAAVIFGGPVLIRSINAHFKIMDNNATDAMQEHIRQSGPLATTTNCSCSPDNDNPTVWSPGNCGIGGCTKLQRYRYRQCTPLLCRKEGACVEEPSCCDEVTLLDCGTTLPGNCTTRSAIHPSFTGKVDFGTCAGTNDCAIGEKIAKVTCGAVGGTTADFYACKNEHPACYPDCVARYGEDNSTQCTAFARSDLYREVAHRLSSTDTPVRGQSFYTAAENPNGVGAYKLDMAFVHGVGSCDTATPRYCENYCTNCRIPNSSGTSCVVWSCNPNPPIPLTVARNAPVSTTVDPGDASIGTFKVTAYADDLDLGVACFNADGTINQQAGNRHLGSCPGDASILPVSVKGVTWCYSARMMSLGTHAQVSCIGNYAYVQFWAGPGIPADGWNPTPTIGYQACRLPSS
ncbi:MAG: hypothetical protein HQL17_00640 [Candidatus Omnitrophica bacterium]|nr:hypothetical protein [Candidatus Omnitrophota bacterium]